MASSSASLEGLDTTKEMDQLNLPSFTRTLLVADPVGGSRLETSPTVGFCRNAEERRLLWKLPNLSPTNHSKGQICCCCCLFFSPPSSFDKT